MKQINIKKQMFTMTFIIIMISFIICFFVILPAIKNINHLQNDITSTQQFLEEQYEKTQRMRRSVHNLDEIEEQVSKFQNFSIENGSELEIITRLESLASKHNINQILKATFYDNEVSKPPMEDLPLLLKNQDYYIFSFNSVGTYENLTKYLKSIEQLPYYFIINSIQFSQKADTTETSLRFDAIVFIQTNDK